MDYFILVIVGLAGFFLGRMSVGGFTPADKERLSELRRKAKKALDRRTEERKERILEVMRKEGRHEEELKLCGIDFERKEFSRRDVEKLLGVGDDTARGYLNELEEEGKIRQVGESGPSVYYELLGE